MGVASASTAARYWGRSNLTLDNHVATKEIRQSALERETHLRQVQEARKRQDSRKMEATLRTMSLVTGGGQRGAGLETGGETWPDSVMAGL